MSKMLLEELCASFEEASASLRPLKKRKMFGCNAFFKDSAIFGLIWKDGRIGLRFEDEPVFKELLAMKGAEPWTIGKKVMGKWVLVPEDFHDDNRVLTKWVKTSHSLATAKLVKKATKKPTKKSPAKAAKKVVKKTAAKRSGKGKKKT